MQITPCEGSMLVGNVQYLLNEEIRAWLLESERPDFTSY